MRCRLRAWLLMRCRLRQALLRLALPAAGAGEGCGQERDEEAEQGLWGPHPSLPISAYGADTGHVIHATRAGSRDTRAGSCA